MLGEDAYSHDRDDLPWTSAGWRRPASARSSARSSSSCRFARATAAAALGAGRWRRSQAIGIAEVGRGSTRPRRASSRSAICSSLPTTIRKTIARIRPTTSPAYTLTSRLCDCLTPRSAASSALDVGTGSGVQALLAARQAAHVVATDINPRALAFTELNAALNGFTNIEVRLGSLFEAVAGERFDLITCNPPYVVSPESRWAYRDSGLQGDEVSGAASSAPRPTILPRAASQRCSSAGSGRTRTPPTNGRSSGRRHCMDCDTWILRSGKRIRSTTRRRGTGARRQAGGVRRGARLLDSYLEELGAGWVSEGAILLHRRPGRRHSCACGRDRRRALETAGDQVRRAVRGRAAPRRAGAVTIWSTRVLRSRCAWSSSASSYRGGRATADASGERSARRRHQLHGRDDAAALELVERLDGTVSLRRLPRAPRPPSAGMLSRSAASCSSSAP